jgi:PAS domain-containing protein
MSSADILEYTHVRIEEAEKDFERALDAACVGYWHWDARADYLRWDRRMHLIFGTDPTTFIPQYSSFDNLLIPADRDRIAVDVSNALDGKEAFRNVFTTKDGRLVAGYGSVVRDAEGTALKLVGINILVRGPDDKDTNACSFLCPLARAALSQP